jgi:hypothetical protein
MARRRPGNQRSCVLRPFITGFARIRRLTVSRLMGLTPEKPLNGVWLSGASPKYMIHDYTHIPWFMYSLTHLSIILIL